MKWKYTGPVTKSVKTSLFFVWASHLGWNNKLDCNEDTGGICEKTFSTICLSSGRTVCVNYSGEEPHCNGAREEEDLMDGRKPKLISQALKWQIHTLHFPFIITEWVMYSPWTVFVCVCVCVYVCQCYYRLLSVGCAMSCGSSRLSPAQCCFFWAHPRPST